ncbi:MAG: radical SAM protein, partial [Bacteroidota bacterium]
MAGIYIHIPFCKQACNYCDFHFSTSLNHKSELIAAICRELEMRKNYLPEKEIIETIYFGGGTPSLLTAAELMQIFETINKNFTVAPDAEITLEANPDDLSPVYIKELKSTSINRLSIGIQSFRNEDLKWMNRAHQADQALNSVREAAAAGFNNISIDLI